MDKPTRRSSPAQRLPFALWVFCVVLYLPMVNAPNWATRQDTLYERAGLVVTVWIILALEALLLHGIVRPYSPRWGWLRVLPCIVGAGLLWQGLMMADTADMGPPFTYSIGLFPILAALVLSAIGLHRGIGWVLLRSGRRPAT